MEEAIRQFSRTRQVLFSRAFYEMSRKFNRLRIFKPQGRASSHHQNFCHSSSGNRPDLSSLLVAPNLEFVDARVAFSLTACTRHVSFLFVRTHNTRINQLRNRRPRYVGRQQRCRERNETRLRARANTRHDRAAIIQLETNRNWSVPGRNTHRSRVVETKFAGKSSKRCRKKFRIKKHSKAAEIFFASSTDSQLVISISEQKFILRIEQFQFYKTILSSRSTKEKEMTMSVFYLNYCHQFLADNKIQIQKQK